MAGRHGTGRCGFAIDDVMLPGLAEVADLEIVDAATDLLIYRRQSSPDIIPGATFRLETHLLPLWRLDDVFASRFRYWYKGIDRHGRETATQVFCLDKSSIYASGRLLYKNFEYYLAKGVRCFAAIRNPHDELAERLLVLQNVGSRAEQLLGARDALIFEPAIAFAGELKTLEDAELKRAFRRLAPEAAAALSNPLTRQLTTNVPDEMPTSGSVAAALDVLSSFELVGLARRRAAFRRRARGPRPALPPTFFPRCSSSHGCATSDGAYAPFRNARPSLKKTWNSSITSAPAFDKVS